MNHSIAEVLLGEPHGAFTLMVEHETPNKMRVSN